MITKKGEAKNRNTNLISAPWETVEKCNYNVQVTTILPGAEVVHVLVVWLKGVCSNIGGA